MSHKGISPVLTEGTRALALMRAFAETPAGCLVSSGGVALLSFATAKLGLGLALVNPSATAVWPPTGLAFSVILLLGWRMAPALFLGAFAANMTTWGTVVTSLVIAAGPAPRGGKHGADHAENRFLRRCTREIRDDGKGVPKNVLASGGGTGIRGLTERMSHLGGTLQVRSDGNGTVITASLPLPAPR